MVSVETALRHARRLTGSGSHPPYTDAMPVRLLRTLSTVLLAFAIGQAGLGAGYLGSDDELLKQIHYINAFLVVGMVVACIVAGVQYRKEGGPLWPLIFAATLLAVAVPQIILGTNEVVGAHVFLGVLYISAVTSFCSYMWRHQPSGKFAARA